LKEQNKSGGLGFLASDTCEKATGRGVKKWGEDRVGLRGRKEKKEKENWGWRENVGNRRPFKNFRSEGHDDGGGEFGCKENKKGQGGEESNGEKTSGGVARTWAPGFAENTKENQRVLSFRW